MRQIPLSSIGQFAYSMWILRFFSKLLNDRLTPIADNIISESKTAFIKARNILEGVATLHEVLHEMKRSKGQGGLFKIDFEKAYDKVK
jgi:hypothetical protein